MICGVQISDDDSDLQAAANLASINAKKQSLKKKHLFSSFSRQQQNQNDDDSKVMPLDLDGDANYADLQEVKVVI